MYVPTVIQQQPEADIRITRPPHCMEWSLADHSGIYIALSINRLAVICRSRYYGDFGKSPPVVVKLETQT